MAEYVKPYQQRLPVGLDDESRKQLPPTHLRLFVVEARGLRNADVSEEGEGNLSDPFCIVSFHDMRGNTYDTVMFKTRVLEETLDPVWNEEFLLELKAGDAAVAARLEVWDCDKATGEDFLGTARIEFDTHSGGVTLPLGARVENPELGKKPKSVVLSSQEAWGTIRVRWQYERRSSPKQDGLWYIDRAAVALGIRRYDFAIELYQLAKRHDPDNTAIDQLIREAQGIKRTEKKGVKEDMCDSAVDEDSLRAKFDYLDVDGNGWVSKKEFKRFYASFDFAGVAEGDEEIEGILKKYNLLGDDRLSFDEFAILMLKLAQR
eukprot:TRINITY_DN31925_c0_g1_i1.p1 TRINITY_DN31925_c0_g1~~TRINITY_DN31925_c0_g1_i1.p1  ORF type:complete len:319 (+),score=87.03 TRINITY_DN31925_c0_g1_i1:82-1038(+)